MPNTYDTLPEWKNDSNTSHNKADLKGDFDTHVKLKSGVRRTGWKGTFSETESIDIIENDHDENSDTAEEQKNSRQYINQEPGFKVLMI